MCVCACVEWTVSEIPCTPNYQVGLGTGDEAHKSASTQDSKAFHGWQVPIRQTSYVSFAGPNPKEIVGQADCRLSHQHTNTQSDSTSQP